MGGKIESGGHYMPEDADEASSLVRVSSVDDGEVRFHPQGGGRGYVAPIADFESRFRRVDDEELKSLLGTYRRIEVRDDSMPDGTTLSGWTGGGLWNGFVTPAFDLETVKAALADGRLPTTGSCVIFYHEPTDAVVTVDGCGEPVGEFDRDEIAAKVDEGEFEIDGREVWLYAAKGRDVVADGATVRVYDVGDGWCWGEVEPEPAPTPGM